MGSLIRPDSSVLGGVCARAFLTLCPVSPITQVTESEAYAGSKRCLAARFEFFDQQAFDAGRFIYGTTNLETTIHDGTKLLDAWLDEADGIDMVAALPSSPGSPGVS